MTPAEEMDAIITTLVRWQAAQDAKPDSEKETLAVLDLRNERGSNLADALRKRGVEPVELLGATHSTRMSAGSLTFVLRHLANPQSAHWLAKAFEVWRRDDRGDEAAKPVVKRA